MLERIKTLDYAANPGSNAEPDSKPLDAGTPREVALSRHTGDNLLSLSAIHWRSSAVVS
jgi:hypothetical protein